MLSRTIELANVKTYENTHEELDSINVKSYALRVK